MEEATGTQLATLWDSLGPDVKLSVMREVVSIETKMISLSFSQYVFSYSLSCANTYVLAVSYGSIYFASDAVEGAVPANIISETSAELKEKVSKTYTIGPTVDRGFWNKERSTIDISRGPCMLCCSYIKRRSNRLQGQILRTTLYAWDDAKSSGLKTMRFRNHLLRRD